jgi:type IV pilus assembly protein PilV
MDMTMNNTIPMKSQKGVLLLEAMIAILLFSVGVLAVVGLQANAIKNVSQSKYRSDAALFADQIIGAMWADRANLMLYAYPQTGGNIYRNDWVTRLNTALPNPDARVIVSQTNVAGPPASVLSQVTVTIQWQTGDERRQGKPPHQYVATATIN